MIFFFAAGALALSLGFYRFGRTRGYDQGRGEGVKEGFLDGRRSERRYQEDPRP